jgi:hypothetical protein
MPVSPDGQIELRVVCILHAMQEMDRLGILFILLRSGFVEMSCSQMRGSETDASIHALRSTTPEKTQSRAK